MTRTEYQRMTEKELRGRRVRTLPPMSNGNGSIPEGTLLTIRGKQGGLALQCPPCKHCGRAVYITRVEPMHVELLPDAPATEEELG